MAPSRRLRSATRRVVLLIAIWALPGLWDVGHAVAHERDHEEHHATEIAEGLAVSMAANHEHGHSHPDSSPVVSTGKGPTFGSLAALAAAPDLPRQTPLLPWCTRWTAPARASPHYTSASGPRAPPAS